MKLTHSAFLTLLLLFTFNTCLYCQENSQAVQNNQEEVDEEYEETEYEDEYEDDDEVDDSQTTYLITISSPTIQTDTSTEKTLKDETSTAEKILNNQIFEVDEMENPTEVLLSAKDFENEVSMSLIEKAIGTAKFDEKAKTTLKKAQQHYREAVDSLKKGDAKTARKSFNNFLDKLKDTDLEPGVYYFLVEDFNNINLKLNKLYSIETLLPSDFVSSDIALDVSDNTQIEKYITLFSDKYKSSIQSAFEKGTKYKEMIIKILEDYNLPKELYYLPVIESRFSNGDVSSAGAVGLWQIMAHRGRALGLHIDYWIDERKDPQKATKAACIYLKQLYLMLNDWHLALAAYNRGEYGLVRDLKFSNATNINEMTKRNAVPKETQNYVPQFLAVVKIAKDLKKYGFNDLKEYEAIKYDTVKTDKVIDLKIVAQCANTTVDEIKKLNPALKAWCTPHGYPGFELKIPYGTRKTFLQKIAKVKDLNPSPGYIKYKITKGDYLEKIAQKYRTTVSNIKKDNQKLKSNKYLRVGDTIIIRPGKSYYK